MRVCKKCGSENEDKLKFCGYCGEKFQENIKVNVVKKQELIDEDIIDDESSVKESKISYIVAGVFVGLVIILIIWASIASRKASDTQNQQAVSGLNASEQSTKNPKYLLTQAQNYFNNKDYDNAKETINTIINNYPISSESESAKQLLTQVDNAIKEQEQQKQEEQQKKLVAASKNIRTEYDEVEGITWYYDKSTPQYANYNNFHLYIGKKENGSPWLHVKIQYAGEDWIFINKYILKVDDQTFEINPGDFGVKRDNGYGGVWEYYDVNFNNDTYNIVKAIIASNKTIIRYQGDDHQQDRIITSQEKKALQNVLDMYEALGGSFNF